MKLQQERMHVLMLKLELKDRSLAQSLDIRDDLDPLIEELV